MKNSNSQIAIALVAIVASLANGFVIDSDPSEPQFSCATSTYGEYCRLPFIYNGVKHYSCESVDSVSKSGESHCPVRVNDKLEASELVTCLPDSCVLVCTTVKNQRCVFPFKHQGQTYYFCTKDIKKDGKMWCATEVDDNGEAKDFGLCDMNACAL